MANKDEYAQERQTRSPQQTTATTSLEREKGLDYGRPLEGPLARAVGPDLRPEQTSAAPSAPLIYLASVILLAIIAYILYITLR